MGVSGCGKTAVGERLAQRTGWPFIDGDDLHPASNVRKMSAGAPLTDEDRLPWLQSIRDVIVEHAESGGPAIVACSALKCAYRDLLLMGQANTRLVYLRGTPAVLERRLSERSGHFFDPKLLASQLETMEEPEDAFVVDIDVELEGVVDAVVNGLGLRMS
jgi:gluconokinase